MSFALTMWNSTNIQLQKWKHFRLGLKHRIRSTNKIESIERSRLGFKIVFENSQNNQGFVGSVIRFSVHFHIVLLLCN